MRRYYSLPKATDKLSDPNEAIDTVRRTLTRAVDKRLRSDVPLGVFLSGGLDSSIIAAIATQQRPGLKSFSVGLAGSPDLEAARRVASHLGTDHYEHELSREEVMRDLPQILGHLESFDQELVRSAVPCYYAARLAAEHVKVVLTGEGADELFAGYTYHKSYSNMDALQEELRRSGPEHARHQSSARRSNDNGARAGGAGSVPRPRNARGRLSDTCRAEAAP